MRPNQAFYNLLQPKLRLGTVVGGTTTNIGNDYIITFTQSGSISFSGYGSIRLLVAGGGAGGYKTSVPVGTANYSGKGGYGGEVVLYDNGYPIEPGSFNITVGSGGAGNTTGGAGGVGGSSTFGTITAQGGQLNNLSNTTYGTAVPAFEQYIAAGGGGSNGLYLPEAHSGVWYAGWGITSSISGSTIVYGAGGGGGGMTTGNQYNSGMNSGGSPGGDGGISPAYPNSPTNGSNGIYGGGGGGGASHTTSTTSTTSNGGNGGDGIVIVRFTLI